MLAANVEGNNENLFPWANAGVPRYMQLHGDLGLTPLQIKKLAFRMDARDTVNYTAVNQIDLEMWMGHGVRATQPSWFFAQNYVRPRTATIARKVINTQAHSLDPARADAIKVCNSNGRSTVVPTSDTSHVVDATRLFSQLGGTQATESVFFFGSIVGYALVTGFTY